MALQSWNIRSRHYLLTLSIFIIAMILLSIALFREELFSAVQTLKTISKCSCPATAPTETFSTAHQGHNNHHESLPKNQEQQFQQTTYADLTILQELPPANVLWVNESGTSNAKPEAWGISMFHALHCVKIWQESVDPGTHHISFIPY